MSPGPTSRWDHLTSWGVASSLEGSCGHWLLAEAPCPGALPTDLFFSQPFCGPAVAPVPAAKPQAMAHEVLQLSKAWQSAQSRLGGHVGRDWQRLALQV